MNFESLETEYWNECELPPYIPDNTRHAAPNPVNHTQSIDYIGKLYPNPNNGTMEIEYQIPEDTQAIISITNPLGQILAQWYLPPEHNKLEIKVPNLSSGVYYYEISIEKRILQKDKIIIIK